MNHDLLSVLMKPMGALFALILFPALFWVQDRCHKRGYSIFGYRIKPK